MRITNVNKIYFIECNSHDRKLNGEMKKTKNERKNEKDKYTGML